jgi:hypothetical protein
MDLESLVSEKNFQGRQQQQPYPNGGKKLGGANGMLVREFGVSLRAH